MSLELLHHQDILKDKFRYIIILISLKNQVAIIIQTSIFIL